MVGIIQTGDLQGRDRKKIFEIYRRLSGATSLMPTALAFCLDSECMSENDKQDLERSSQGMVHFLPKRMYENFLLDAPAISAVVNAIPEFRALPVTEDEVNVVLNAKRADRRHYCQGFQQIPQDWMSYIDGAHVLSEIFAELSGNHVSYEKMRHSVAITDWILHNRPAHFRELANWIIALLPAA